MSKSNLAILKKETLNPKHSYTLYLDKEPFLLPLDLLRQHNMEHIAYAVIQVALSLSSSTDGCVLFAGCVIDVAIVGTALARGG